ncbi:hypothetical protein G6F35_018771 [Rhizopus arrhizus]|nr:hypothetical protein G6F35_018771 [Rhizopus arrhizus]
MPRRNRSRRGAARTWTSAPAGSRRSRRRSARRYRSSGSAGPAPDPSRRCHGTPGRWSSRCNAARRRPAPA